MLGGDPAEHEAATRDDADPPRSLTGGLQVQVEADGQRDDGAVADEPEQQDGLGLTRAAQPSEPGEERRAYTFGRRRSGVTLPLDAAEAAR